MSQGRRHLELLKQSLKKEDIANGLPHVNLGNAIIVAGVSALEGILSSFLFAGMKLSYTRRKDAVPGITHAVRLWTPLNRGEDITLEVCVEPSFGKCILALNKESVQDLHSVLDSFLFGAMNASRRRKEEVADGNLTCTSAVEVVEDVGDKGADSQVRITVDFSTGMGIWNNAFTPASLS